MNIGSSSTTGNREMWRKWQRDNYREHYNVMPIAYTNGHCSTTGSKDQVSAASITANAGYGVYWHNRVLPNVSEKLVGEQTQQRAEFEAIKTAMKQIYIFSDFGRKLDEFEISVLFCFSVYPLAVYFYALDAGYHKLVVRTQTNAELVGEDKIAPPGLNRKQSRIEWKQTDSGMPIGNHAESKQIDEMRKNLDVKFETSLNTDFGNVMALNFASDAVRRDDDFY